MDWTQDDGCARCGSFAIAPLAGAAHLIRCRDCGTVTEAEDDAQAAPRAPKVRKLRASED
jgi:hypothetical protein